MIKAFFGPKFLGRENINVQLWLRALKKNKNTLIAFNHHMWDYGSVSRYGSLATFDLEYPDGIHYQRILIEYGLKLFE